MTEVEASEDVRIEDMNQAQPNKSCQPTPVGHVSAQRTSLWTGVAALCR